MENSSNKTKENNDAQDDVLAIDLPAPEGWKKKFTPKKGGTPKRNEIVFISPTGEEIKNKRQLDQYLKSHPGGHSASEFDWGTGDTPRRSARLSEKSKATEPEPESETPKKKQKRSSSKNAKDDDDGGQGETAENETAATEETKEHADVAAAGGTDEGEESVEGEVIDEEAPLAGKDNNMEETTEKGKMTAEEEAPADKNNVEEDVDKINVDKPDDEDGNIKTSNAKEEDDGNKLLSAPETKDINNLGGSSDRQQLNLGAPNEIAPSEQDQEITKDAEAVNEVDDDREDQVHQESPAEKMTGIEEAKLESNEPKEDQEAGKSHELGAC